jgi:hypothetical protein
LEVEESENIWGIQVDGEGVTHMQDEICLCPSVVRGNVDQSEKYLLVNFTLEIREWRIYCWPNSELAKLHRVK